MATKEVTLNYVYDNLKSIQIVIIVNLVYSVNSVNIGNIYCKLNIDQIIFPDTSYIGIRNPKQT